MSRSGNPVPWTTAIPTIEKRTTVPNPGEHLPLAVFCKEGHELASSGSVYRLIASKKGNKDSVKVWISALGPAAKKGDDDDDVVDLVKTTETLELDIGAHTVVVGHKLMCQKCNMEVGKVFEGLRDASDRCVATHEGNYERPVLAGVLYGNKGLKILFDANKSETDLKPYPPSPFASKRDIENVEDLVAKRVTQHPTLLSELDVVSKNGGLYHAQAKLKEPLIQVQLALALNGHFASVCERLHALITVVGEFLSPACVPWAVRDRFRDPKRMNHNKSFGTLFLKVVKRHTPTPPHNINVAAKMLSEQLRQTQMYQKSDPKAPDAFSKDSVVGPFYDLIYRTRNVIAHSRDPTGAERRFFLRQFGRVFEGAEKAIAFLGECQGSLQMDTKGGLAALLYLEPFVETDVDSHIATALQTN